MLLPTYIVRRCTGIIPWIAVRLAVSPGLWKAATDTIHKNPVIDQLPSKAKMSSDP